MSNNQRDINHLVNLDFSPESSTSSSFPTGGNNGNDDLSLFSNTHFFDFDIGRNLDASAVDDLIMEQEKYLQKSNDGQALSTYPSTNNSNQNSNNNEFSQFSISPPIMQQFASTSTNTQNTQDPIAPLPTQNHHQPIAPAPTPTTIQQQIQPQQVNKQPTTVEPATKKRKTSSTSSVDNSSSNSPSAISGGGEKLGGEEDKRRRNTAASARFRMKKKLREQEMERSAKEMQDKLTALERKVFTLEMENQWLRKLVVEKNEARDHETLKAMKKEALGLSES